MVLTVASNSVVAGDGVEDPVGEVEVECVSILLV